MDFPRDSSGRLAGVLHPEFDRKDFLQLRRGHPIFKLFDGTDVLFEPREDTSGFFGVSRYVNLTAFFIGEGAYYEKGYVML